MFQIDIQSNRRTGQWIFFMLKLNAFYRHISTYNMVAEQERYLAVGDGGGGRVKCE